MGQKFQNWISRSEKNPSDFNQLSEIIRANRWFNEVGKLEYGNYGLDDTIASVSQAIRENKRIALYADYDVDGTMSCVSWIWFFRAIGFKNFLHYIPDRGKEGYGVNLDAVKHLIHDQKADLIITMDTGITANVEAAYCKANGAQFICTDHHKIQPDKMPDCIILNPKFHPDPEYQELCGCGITFVLLRKLGGQFPVEASVWNDILSLVGMATICDVVPLNGVNHKIAKMGVDALLRSQRPILRKLRAACSVLSGVDEKDVGFRLGPRINAVGRLEHAHAVIDAFLSENPDELVKYMEECNDRRKVLQQKIIQEADDLAKKHMDDPILFLGGHWHPGVVGIAASRLAEKYWKPTWLFERGAEMGKGSARSIHGFDVTEAMVAAKDSFVKFGGHRAAGGYSFKISEEDNIRKALNEYALQMRNQDPKMWESRAFYDCVLPIELAKLDLVSCLDDLKPFGHGFEEPKFVIEAKIQEVVFYSDKQTGQPKHTAIYVEGARGASHKVMYFNEVNDTLKVKDHARLLVSAQKNYFRGVNSLSLMGHDVELMGSGTR